MLTLSLNNNVIPLPVDFSIELTWKSPVTAFDNIPSGYSLSFSLPINEYTRALFGNPERFAKYRSGNDQKFTGFEVRFGGVLLMAGTLQINGCPKNTYDLTLIDQVGVLGENEQERDLLDIPEFDEIETFVNKALYDPDVDRYCCFPLRNAGFFKDKGRIIEKTRMVPDPMDPTKTIQETYDTELLTDLFVSPWNPYGQVNAVNEDGTVFEREESIDIYRPDDHVTVFSVITPFYFLNYVIDKALKNNHFNLNETNYLKEHEALKNLCIYNTWDITEMHLGFKIVGGSEVDYEKFWESGTELISKGKEVDNYQRQYLYKLMKAKNHLPKLKVGEMLMSIQNLFNVCFHFLPNNTVNVFSRDEILKALAVDLNEYFLGDWELGDKMEVALKFVREHDDKDLIFSERYTDLSDRRADIVVPATSEDVTWTWADLDNVTDPQPGEIRYLKSVGIYVEYKWISESFDDPVTKKPQTIDALGWQEISIGFQDGWYEYGRVDVEEIKTSWSTTVENITDDPYVITKMYPEVNQPGNMNIWRNKNQDFSPRLLFFKPTGGKNYGGNTFLYEDRAGHYINISMEYNDGYDAVLLDNFWKRWNRLWANRLPVTGEFDLPVNVLRHLVYNICQKYRTREGEFLIDEMSCTLYIDHISETTIKGFKVE